MTSRVTCRKRALKSEGKFALAFSSTFLKSLSTALRKLNAGSADSAANCGYWVHRWRFPSSPAHSSHYTTLPHLSVMSGTLSSRSILKILLTRVRLVLQAFPELVTMPFPRIGMKGA